MDSNEMTVLLEFAKKLNELVASQVQIAIKNQPRRTFRSQEIDQLAEALSVAQGLFKEITFNRRNPLFLTQYVDYDSVKNAVKDALKDNHLAIIHRPLEYGDETVLESMLMHSSGQFVEASSRIRIIAGDSSVYISVLNEYKKQHILALLGISAKNNIEEDDLGAETAQRKAVVSKGTAINYVFGAGSEAEYSRIDQHELSEIDYELSGDGMEDIYNEILKNLKITKLADIPKSQYHNVKTYIQKIKEDRKRPK